MIHYIVVIKKGYDDIIRDIVDHTTSDNNTIIRSLSYSNPEKKGIIESLIFRISNFDNLLSTSRIFMDNDDVENMKYLMSSVPNANRKIFDLLVNACIKHAVLIIEFLLTYEISQADLLIILVVAIFSEELVIIPISEENLNSCIRNKILYPKVSDKELLVVEKILDKAFCTFQLPETILKGLAQKEVKLIEILINHGVVINASQFFIYACRYKNVELIDYYLTNGVMIDQRIIKEALQTLDVRIYQLFLKYNIDFSVLEYKEHDELLSALENQGLTLRAFCCCILDKNN